MTAHNYTLVENLSAIKDVMVRRVRKNRSFVENLSALKEAVTRHLRFSRGFIERLILAAPIFGQPSNSGYTSVAITTGQLIGTQYVLGAAMPVSSISVYLVDTSPPTGIQCAIYDVNGNLKGYTIVVTTHGGAAYWLTLPFSSPVLLAPGTYYICFNNSGGGVSYYRIASSDNFYQISQAWGTWPATITYPAPSLYDVAIFATGQLPMYIFTRKVAYNRGLVESIYVKDVYSRFLARTRSFIENVVIRESISRLVRYRRSLIENLSAATDVFSYLYIHFRHAYTRLLAETVFVQEVFARRVAYARRSLETPIVRDAFTRVHSFVRSFVENVSTLKDTVARVHSFVRSFVENVSTLKDTVTRRANYSRTFVENLAVRDVFAYVYTRFRRQFIRFFTELLFIQDSLTSKGTFGISTIGSTDYGGDENSPRATRYQSPVNGILTDITLYVVTGSGNVQVGVYSDLNGAPNALLASSGTKAVTGPGWFDFGGFNLNITQGAYYWLTFTTDTGSVQFGIFPGYTNQIAYPVAFPIAFGTWPNPFGPANYVAQAYSIYATYVARTRTQQILRAITENLSSIQEFFTSLWKLLTVFIDGFETGNFNKWTGQYDTAGCTSTVENLHPHSGSYDAKFTANASGIANTYYAIPLSIYGPYWARAYYQMAVMPPSGGTFVLIKLDDSSNGGGSSGNYVAAAIANIGGSLYWQIWVAISGTVTTYTEATPSNPAINAWYDIEILRDVTNGVATLWVNGVQKVTVSGLAMTGRSMEVAVGLYNDSTLSSATAYADDVVVSDFWISRYISAVIEGIMTQELFVRAALYKRTMVENLSTLKESVSRRLSIIRKLVENFIVTDVFAYVHTTIKHVYTRLFAETIFVSDAFTRARRVSRAFTENMSSLQDVFSRRAGRIRQFVENIVITDFTARLVRYKRILIENLSTLTDVFSYLYARFKHVYARLLVEMITVQEAFARRVAYTRKSLEIMLQQDVFARAIRYVRRVAESLVARDVYSRTIRNVRINFEAVLVRDVSVRAVAYKRSLQEAVVVREFLTRIKTALRSLVENLSSLKDTVTRRANYIRALTENLSVRDVFAYVHTTIRHVYTRLLAETIVIQEAFARRATYVRRSLETPIVTDAFTRAHTFIRHVLDSLVIQDILTRKRTAVRSFVENLYTLKDAVTRGVINSRLLIENALALAFAPPITFGQPSNSGYTSLPTGASQLIGTQFALGTTMLVTSISVYIQDGGPPTGIQCGIYDVNGNLKGYTTVAVTSTTSAVWITCPFSSPLLLPPGTYYICFNNSGGAVHYYRIASSDNFYQISQAWGTWPSTITYPAPSLYDVSIFASGFIVSHILTRKVAYNRRLAESTYVLDIFSRFLVTTRSFIENVVIRESTFRVVGFKRTLTENLSAVTDVFSYVYAHFRHAYTRLLAESLIVQEAFTRRVTYVRRSLETPIVTDAFSYVYTRLRHAYTRLLAESLVIREVFARRVAYTRRSLETPIVTDAFTRVRTFVRSLMETVVVRESMLRAAAYKRALSESVILRESLTRIRTLVRSFIEQLSVLRDIVSRRVNYSRKQTEYSIISDVLTRIKSVSRTLVENVAVLQDVFSRRVRYTRQLLEKAVVYDVFSRTHGFIRKFVEVAVVRDSFARVKGFVRSFVEQLTGLQDVMTRSVKYSRKTIETVLVQDVFSRLYRPFSHARYFIENVVIYESMVRIATYRRRVLETVIISESFRRMKGLVRSFVEQLSALKDSLSRRVNYSRKQVENPNVSDVFARRSRTLRAFTENLSALRDVFSRRAQYVRSFVEGIVVRDVFFRVARRIRQFIENVVIQESVARVVTYTRRFTETVIVRDFFARVKTIRRSMVESLSVLRDSFSRRVNYFRRQTEYPVVSDIFTRARRVLRAFTENLSSLRDVFSRRVQYVRQLLENAVVYDVFSRRVNYTRRTVEIILVRDVFTRVRQTLRFFTENLGSLKDMLVRRFRGSRTFVESTLLSDLLKRTTSSGRRLLEDLSSIKDILSYVYKPVRHVFIRNFVEDLSAISDTLARIVSIQDIINELTSLGIAVANALQNVENTLKTVKAKFKLTRRK